MAKPLDEDFNYNNVFQRIEEETTDAGKFTSPREARGGTFAPVDIKLIKEALGWYVNNCFGLTDIDERNIANLLHRLNRIG